MTVATAPPALRSAFGPPETGLLLLLALVWGFSFLFIKVAVAVVSPLWLVAVRTCLGAAVLMLVLRGTRRTLPHEPALWWHFGVLGVAGNLVPWAAIAWAEQTIPSGLAAVLNALVPALTVVVAASVGLERLSTRKVLGLLVALCGTAVVVGAGVAGGAERLGGVLAVLGAAALYAVCAVYAKRFVIGRQGALPTATGQLLVSAALAVPIAAAVGPTPAWADLGAAPAGSLLALGVLGTGLAFVLFFALIDRVGASNATMVTYLIPVVGLLAGWLVLGERLGVRVVAGTVAIVAGIWIAQQERRSSGRAEPQPSEVAATS